MANLRKLHDQGFGFSVRGDGPIIIAGVDGGSIADVILFFFFVVITLWNYKNQPIDHSQLAGVREGDVIIGIGDVDVKWSSHEEVVSLIKCARNDLSLRLIQPVEKPVQPSKVRSPSIKKMFVLSVDSFVHSFLHTVNDEIHGQNVARWPRIDLAHIDDQFQFGRILGSQPLVEHVGRKEL